MECERSKPQVPERPARILPDAQRSTMTSEQIMEAIKALKDEAYLYIEQALSCDEQDQPQQAFTLYNKGLSTINKGLQHARNIPEQARSGSTWENTQRYVLKMEKSKAQVESRIETLRTHKDVIQSQVDPPPSYEIASSTSIQDDLDSILQDNDSQSSQFSVDAANAVEVFKISDGVQVFYISAQGHVSAPSYPSSLGVYKFTDDAQRGTASASNASEAPPAFLKVGNWVYPLCQGSSPALESFWGAYVFPDIESGPGALACFAVDRTILYTIHSWLFPKCV